MKYIETSKAPEAVGAYSQGVVTGNLLFTAGQIALGGGNKLVGDTPEAQTHQVMKNLTAILGAAGCQLSDVVKTQIFIADQAFFPEVNRAYAEYFEEGRQPARECVVAAPPFPGAHVEMSMIAEVPIAQ